MFIVLRPNMAAINRVANNLGSFTSGKVLPSSSQLGINTSLPLAHLDRENANATFVFLCRNDDINGVVSSVQQVEDRFNRRHQYPWVFLNEEPFTEEFKTCIYLLSQPLYLLIQIYFLQESQGSDGCSDTLWPHTTGTLVPT